MGTILPSLSTSARPILAVVMGPNIVDSFAMMVLQIHMSVNADHHNRLKRSENQNRAAGNLAKRTTALRNILLHQPSLMTVYRFSPV